MLYAVVLAGGRSSRMGQDKALLRLGGRSLLERALALLEALEAGRILVSGRVEGHEGVPDLLPYAGPPGGIYSTLDYIRSHGGLDGSPLLAIPVDMPLLEAEVLARLLESLGEARAIHYEGKVFPCVFRATEDLYRHLRTIFAEGAELGGKRSMKGLLAWAEAKSIPASGFQEGMFRNVNTPEEWESMVRGGILDSAVERRDDRS